ncbi:MAG: type III pantothenate kinase [Chloroflexota bacterium]
MLLAIDIGNTNIYLGLLHNGKWQITWRARTVEAKMPDEYAVLVRNFLSTADLGYRAVTDVIISSVVPVLTQSFKELVEHYMKLDPIVVSHTTKTGIKVAIDQPEQAGADRIVNSAAAAALYGGPAIIIDFGTATTFDVLSGKNEYCGGAITTGINVAADALVSRAARLHKVDLQPPPCAVGRNTIHAMQSGLFWGYVAMIEGMVARLRKEIQQGEEQVKVIATGGLSRLFNEHTDAIDIIEPELTLEGLRVIYELNRGRLS